jgi:hypothetical protein
VTLAKHVSPCRLAKGLCLGRRVPDYLAHSADVWRHRLSECLPTVITSMLLAIIRGRTACRGWGSHPLYYHLSLAESVR